MGALARGLLAIELLAIGYSRSAGYLRLGESRF